jgi:formamidopyrimidine-DNA glycosylase
MPGLVEIEVLRRDLDKEIAGRRIKDVEVRPGTSAMKIIRRHGRRKEFEELLVGGKVDSIERVGKRLLFSLDSGRVIVVDLGTAGRLYKTSASDDVEANTHIIIGFTIGGQLRFVDQKKTGEIYVAPAEEVANDGSLRSFTIDPIDHQFTWQYFSTLLAERDTPMKQLLMDDKFICGLGEIYSDEILFDAGIRHDRLSSRLTSQDVRRLYRSLMEIMQDALKARGTSWGDDDFRDLHGSPGQFQLELKVYEREGESCRRCRSAVVREEIDGGVVTYFCPQCQS